MNLKNFFVINAVIALLFGIGLLLAPETMGSIYGIEVTSSTSLMSRFFGLSLIAIGALTWLVRDVSDTAALRAIVLALLISDTLGIIVSVMGVLAGTMNAVGWSTVVIYVFLAAGYAYFYFKK